MPLASTYVIRTLGCKANTSDSQQLEVELRKRGWVPAQAAATAQLCIINSCTVTNDADKQSRALARKLKREHPLATVVMTGCGAEVDPVGTLRSGGVDLVVGNRNKPQLLERVLNYLDKGDRGADAAPLRNSRHDLDQQWPEPSPETLSDDRIEIRSKKGQTERIRAFIKVQEGCDAFCTYCVIPYGRGPSRSVRTELLVEEVVRLEARGVREVVITGTRSPICTLALPFSATRNWGRASTRVWESCFM